MSALGMASWGTQCADKALGMSSIGVFCGGLGELNLPFDKFWEQDQMLREDEDLLLFVARAFIEVIRCR